MAIFYQTTWVAGAFTLYDIIFHVNLHVLHGWLQAEIIQLLTEGKILCRFKNSEIAYIVVYIAWDISISG